MVDDDTELCDVLQKYLAIEGFDLVGVHEGPGGVAAALSGNYDLVLLDVMLPGLSGFEVLRRIRTAPGETSRIPVLMLTARGDAVDRIVGLEVGADDYLPKPFNERELVARMRAILRRAQAGPSARGNLSPVVEHHQDAARLRIGDVELDMGSRSVRRGGQEIVLTAVEFDTLAVLMKSVGVVVTRQSISQQVFDRQLLPFDRSLDTHMSNLRRKLGSYPDGSERIKTLRSIGYIYVMPESVVETTPS
jgi:two-component system response regulator CpxR